MVVGLNFQSTNTSRKTNMDTQHAGLEKVDSIKIWTFLVSMLDFWGVMCKYMCFFDIILPSDQVNHETMMHVIFLFSPGMDHGSYSNSLKINRQQTCVWQFQKVQVPPHVLHLVPFNTSQNGNPMWIPNRTRMRNVRHNRPGESSPSFAALPYITSGQIIMNISPSPGFPLK